MTSHDRQSTSDDHAIDELRWQVQEKARRLDPGGGGVTRPASRPAGGLAG